MSRDVVFDESQGWNWKLVEKEVSSDPGKFKIAFGDSGNRGISDDDDDVAEIGDNDDDSVTEFWSEPRVDDVMLRRSSRETKKPSYLEDYILLAEIDSEELLMLLNDEPWSYSEAKE